MQEQMIQFESEGYSPSAGGNRSSGLHAPEVPVQAAMRHVPWRTLVGLTLVMQVTLLTSLVPALHIDLDLFPHGLHTVSEMLAITVAMLIVVVAWHAHDDHLGGNVLILACGFLLVAVLDCAHVLWHPTDPATFTDIEKSAYFSFASRYAASLSLLAVAFLRWRPLRLKRALRWLPIGTLALAMILCWLMPTQDSLHNAIASQGAGGFRNAVAYGVIVITLVAALRFYRQSMQPQSWDAAGLCAAAVVLMLSDLCFTQQENHGLFLLGHVYKVIAYYFIYRAIFVSSVLEPYRRLRTALIESKSAEHMLEFLGYHDPLTNLPNRLLLKDRVERAIAYADRNKTKAALLCLDLDNFKTVNESLGHAAGDALVQAVAARLRECIRNSDTISRLGGDEFVIVLQDVPAPDAAALPVDRMMELMQQPFDVSGRRIVMSMSVGVAVYPDDGTDFMTLMKKADMAMYRAKQAGRNTYRFFDAQMGVDAVDLLHLRSDLSIAIERNEFVLHYQPQIDVASGKVVGAEALIRWNHPELGMVPPNRFIPVAEESGLIVPIGEWVIREACRQAAAWRKDGLPPLVMSVNLSGVQFLRGDIVRTVMDALNESALRPSQLELELTESILIQDTATVLATVRRLKALGLRLAIDDFGAGYSSFSYLKRFPLDRLKIDQSFVRDLVTDPDDAAIVKAIVQMAHSLGLQTVAEGVEDQGVLKHLQGLQCDQVQGFHFARPMPAKDFANYLVNTRGAIRSEQVA